MQTGAAPHEADSPFPRVPQLGRMHVLAGLITLVAFLLTGVYMKTHSISTLPDGARLLYRSRHIYLLFSGLLNLMVGLRYPTFAGAPTMTSGFGSSLLLVAPLFICAGFFLEPPSGSLSTPWSHFGVIAAAVGTVLLAIALRNAKRV